MESADAKKLLVAMIWLCYIKKMTIITQIKDMKGRQTLEPEKAHSTGEFVIVAKFGNHVLCCLASTFRM